MMRLVRPLLTFASMLALWEALVRASGIAPFLLPAPSRVAVAAATRADLLVQHAAVTAAEIALGFAGGALLGVACALAIAWSRAARRWLLPLVVASQAIPVFALAPLLVLWLGYGMASKVAMAVVIIFFPVTAAFLDGLRRTEPGWLDLARTMTFGRPGAERAILWHVRLPAALPALASGLRVAAAVAPIGAVVGEWVGSGAGLGYLMLHANARMQIDLLFAALLVLCLIGAALYFGIDAALRRALPWQAESLPTEDA
jgi:putative hydroxymethylpyrimidine transport system permease protein